jgi:hypothetical protein
MKMIELTEEAHKYLIDQGVYGFKKRFPKYTSIALCELSQYRFDFMKKHPELKTNNYFDYQKRQKRKTYYEKVIKPKREKDPSRFKEQEKVMEHFRLEYAGGKKQELYYGEPYPFEEMIK